MSDRDKHLFCRDNIDEEKSFITSTVSDVV